MRCEEIDGMDMKVDWSKLRSMGNPENLHFYLDDLILAKDDKDARSILLKLDNCFQVQDTVYESALYVIKYLFIKFKLIQKGAMGSVLFLINSICSGVPSREEEERDNSNIVVKCLGEVNENFSKLVYVIEEEFDMHACMQSIELMSRCVDKFPYNITQFSKSLRFFYLKASIDYDEKKKYSRALKRQKKSSYMEQCEYYSERFSIDLG